MSGQKDPGYGGTEERGFRLGQGGPTKAGKDRMEIYGSGRPDKVEETLPGNGKLLMY